MTTPNARHAAFAHWVLFDRGSTVQVPPGATPQSTGPGAMLLCEVWSIPELLNCLWDDQAPVAPAVQVALALPTGTTHAQAARLIAALRAEPGGGASNYGDVVDQLTTMPAEEVEAALASHRPAAPGPLVRPATVPGSTMPG